MDDSWSPWKLTPTGMVLVTVVVLIVAAVIAKWPTDDERLVSMGTGLVDPTAAGSAAPAMSLDRSPAASARSASPHLVTSITECNRYAANRVGYRDKTGGESALYSQNEKTDERYRRVYASCMRSRGYAG